MKILFLEAIVTVITILVVITFKAHAQNSRNWDLNDVSYLAPLPSTVEQENLIDWSEQLLPVRVINELPRLMPGSETPTVIRQIKVVAIRIDPCFQALPLSPCQAQVRFVWQPLVIGVGGKATTVDAAYHTFYDLTDEHFQNLLTKLKAWKARYPRPTDMSSPLQVHPVLKGNPQALIEFNRLITAHLQQSKLTRATVMVLRGGGNMWAFVGLDLIPQQDGSTSLQPIRIPRLTQAAQTFVNQAVPFDAFETSVISPAPIEPQENFADFVKLATRTHFLTEAQLLENIRSAFKFENPKTFHSENLDCVSCHLAQPVREWALPELKKKNPIVPLFEEQYANAKYDLSNTSSEMMNTGQIRGIGYFGTNIVISQRVIHDSAEVADLLNTTAR